MQYNPQWVVQHIFDKSGNSRVWKTSSWGWIQQSGKKLSAMNLVESPTKSQGQVRGTKAVKWIYKKDVPTNNKVTCVNMVCNYRHLKEENTE